jgi:hypothetical protein
LLNRLVDRPISELHRDRNCVRRRRSLQEIVTALTRRVHEQTHGAPPCLIAGDLFSEYVREPALDLAIGGPTAMREFEDVLGFITLEALSQGKR